MTAAGALVRSIMILIVAVALPSRAEDANERAVGGHCADSRRRTNSRCRSCAGKRRVGRINHHSRVRSERHSAHGHQRQPPDVSFTVKGPLGIQLNLRLLAHADNKLAGNFEQAGNRAPATLQKTGPPQVEYAPRSTPVAKELEGEWKGDYEMLGYTRHVSIKFANHPDGATADFVIVGRKHNVLPVDLVTQEGDLVTVDSHEMGFSFEGRLRNGKLTGAIRQAATETPLVLERAKS